MKYHPILFRPEMVRAILTGAKTETRRPIKNATKGPAWKRGDRLWIRETWYEQFAPSGYAYLADHQGLAETITWRPSIHMPKWACRLVLEVLQVPAERIHQITDEGAMAEGVRDRLEFEELWRKIHSQGAHAWQRNPQVWVIRFRALKGQELVQALKNLRGE